ncbi:MAG TPA: DUF2624 domain-containing protein [Bacillales bacterium]|nr:DUF2624 domain-containing protein [Bacillales bacterium]
MNGFIKQMINQKLNHLTPEQLLQLAKQYDLSITPRQAEQITAILRRHQINIADDRQRKQILQEISAEVDPAIAKKIQALFQQFL